MNVHRWISCFFSFMCFTLLLVVHCSNSWRTYEPPMGSYAVGLWTICSDKSGCRKLTGGNAMMELTRIFMVIALLASFLALVWAIEWDYIFYCNFTLLPKPLATSICNFVAGTSVMIGVVMFEIESTRIPKTAMSFKDWAFYLSCVISNMLFLIAMFDFTAYKCLLWGTQGSRCPVDPELKGAAETPIVAPALL